MKIALIAFSLLAVLAVNMRTTHACSCSPFVSASVEEFTAKADKVFIGTVETISKYEARSTGPDGRFVDPRKFQEHPLTGLAVTFRVDRNFKGATESQVMVLTSGSTAGCGVRFRKGERYLLYLDNPNKDGAFAVGACGPSKHADNASDDIATLESLSTPQAGTASPGSRGCGCQSSSGPIQSALVVFMLMLWAAFRKYA